MNKKDLAERLAAKTGIPKNHALSYTNDICEIIQKGLLAEGKVIISDFGTFTVSHRKAFEGNHPQTGEHILVPERRIPVFRAGRGLREALNGELLSTKQ
tara:strand:- start:834 stop:1130 length:297 start_codon:yes stop_codon:yes gene_type:complete